MKVIFVTLKGSIEGDLETMDMSHLEVTGYLKRYYYAGKLIPRKELEGKPIFKGWYGPMWDGDRIRYEDEEAYDFYSR